MLQWEEMMANLKAARAKLDAADDTRFGDLPTLLDRMAGDLDKAIVVAELLRDSR